MLWGPCPLNCISLLRALGKGTVPQLEPCFELALPGGSSPALGSKILDRGFGYELARVSPKAIYFRPWLIEVRPIASGLGAGILLQVHDLLQKPSNL